ncbi:MAG: hypothetical protein MK106_14110 [Mariniblastus sp.]|nr:hypothetical protein [Mariniblastus sp.]
MFKKIIFSALLVSVMGWTGQKSDASICLFLSADSNFDNSEVIVFDNQLAGYTQNGWTSTHDDANMTLGAAVYNGSAAGFDVAVSTAASKPLLVGNQIDLNSVVLGTGEIFVGMYDYGFVDNGLGFYSQIGGTTQGAVTLGTFVDFDPAEDLNFSPVYLSEDLDQSPFADSNQTNLAGSSSTQTEFGMAVVVNVVHDKWNISSFDASFAQTPEPTTALIWSVMAGMGLVVRRRR